MLESWTYDDGQSDHRPHTLPRYFVEIPGVARIAVYFDPKDGVYTRDVKRLTKEEFTADQQAQLQEILYKDAPAFAWLLERQDHADAYAPGQFERKELAFTPDKYLETSNTVIYIDQQHLTP